jgi:tRNA nucleotidyltransferase (CCA-adding enzyme)
VRPAQLWNFAAASRVFLERPSVSSFIEPKITPLTKTEFHRAVASRGSSIVCIALGRIDAVVDILWSQLFRTQRALVHLLENSDFEVIRSSSWTDEKSLSILLFEMASVQLPLSKRHRGPPVSRLAESSAFVSKHFREKDTVSGPWIEDDRWFVEKKRAIESAHALLTSILRSGGSNVGVAPLLVQVFKKKAEILEGNEVGPLLSRNQEFAKFMRVFVAGRPTWLA